ncbi:MAG: hypothetical protein DCC67_12415 [Planctomycetota bacterium]|nr:MAG: hypothetical protein DCC67_12415 [Planctomycetota bacterium]
MHGPVATYGLTLAAIAAAWVARWLLDPWLEDHLPYVTFFVAVAAAAWLGGVRPALLATALGFVLAWYFFVPTRFSFALMNTQHTVGLAMYLMVSLAFAGFGEVLVAAKRRAEAGRDLLRTTLASIGDAVITTDADGRINSMNAVAESVTGCPQHEAVGQPLEAVFRIVNEATRQPVENPAARALREGVIVGLANHTVLIRKDGAELPIDDSAAPIRDESGHVRGCVLVFRDVSGKRAAEEAMRESENRFRNMADNAPALLWVANPEGAGVFLSQGWYEYTGQTEGEALGFGWLDAVHPDDREGARLAFLAATRRREAFSIDYRLRRADGEYRWCIDSGRPRLDESGEFRGYVGSVIDVHERKQAEQRLHEADRRKDEFLAVLAHELRGPLAPLRNMLEVMKMAHGDAATLQQARDTMERQVGHMVRLVDDLLDVNRITRDKLELRKDRVELGSIVRQSVEACRPLTERASHELIVTMPPRPIYLEADPVRLAQVFSNRLNNACKYTEPGGKIWLAAKVEQGDVLVSVKDSGTGIPPDKLQSVFEMFTQVDRPLERSQGGLGIGLTLAKRLVEMHGGTITAASEGEGAGSEFIVRLPLLEASLSPATRETPHATPAPARRILIVDDNRDSATSLAMLLKLKGNETHTAHDGVEALEQAARFLPEMVLLDIGLPRMNGLEVCRRMREQPWGKDTVIVALTGWGQDADRRRSQAAGFDRHLVKPVDLQSLTEMLAELDGTTV